jgi:hypothetical protein
MFVCKLFLEGTGCTNLVRNVRNFTSLRCEPCSQDPPRLTGLIHPVSCGSWCRAMLEGKLTIIRTNCDSLLPRISVCLSVNCFPRKRDAHFQYGMCVISPRFVVNRAHMTHHACQDKFTSFRADRGVPQCLRVNQLSYVLIVAHSSLEFQHAHV